MATIFWILMESRPTPETERWNTYNPFQGGDLAIAREKRCQVLTALAFRFPLAPASWVALRQHHGASFSVNGEASGTQGENSERLRATAQERHRLSGSSHPTRTCLPTLQDLPWWPNQKLSVLCFSFGYHEDLAHCICVDTNLLNKMSCEKLVE